MKRMAEAHPSLADTLTIMNKWGVSDNIGFVLEDSVFRASIVLNMPKYDNMQQMLKYGRPGQDNYADWDALNARTEAIKLANCLRTMFNLGVIPIDIDSNVFSIGYGAERKIVIADFQHYSVEPGREAYDYRESAYEEVKSGIERDAENNKCIQNDGSLNGLTLPKKAQDVGGYYTNTKEAEVLNSQDVHHANERLYSGSIKMIYKLIKAKALVRPEDIERLDSRFTGANARPGFRDLDDLFSLVSNPGQHDATIG
jgi:hypothetical protein